MNDMTEGGLESVLANIRVVLVCTTHPGNIGAVARAMKTMGLSSLYLVQPKIFPGAEATARASGADDILASAIVTDNLDEALRGCRLVVGASARLRRLTWAQYDPRQCAVKVVEQAEHDQIALVFGREHAGLTNEELERCQYLVHIPSNPQFSSLNLAAAVQVLAYEVRMAALARSADVVETTHSKRQAEQQRLANAEQLDGYYQHLERVLSEIGFLHPDHPRKMMRRLKRLFYRASLSEVEVNILRGILSSIEKKNNS